MPELRIWLFAGVVACSSKDAPAPIPAPPPKDAATSSITLLMASPTQVDGGWVIDAGRCPR